MNADATEHRDREWAERARIAQAAASQAFLRLLTLAETSSSGQVRRIARFLAATYDGKAFPFDVFELRAVDIAISDDMLVCLDALRWGSADLCKLRRVQATIAIWLNLKTAVACSPSAGSSSVTRVYRDDAHSPNG